jgi:ankyrin repeat protein
LGFGTGWDKLKAKILFPVIIVPAIIIGIWLLIWFLSDNMLEWRRTWQHTPAWKLALAVKQQDTSKIAKIAKAHPQLLNYQEPSIGATVLIWAVGEEKYRSAEALLKCGANPNITATCGGQTALFEAAHFSWVDTQAKNDPKYVKMLLKYGADPNIYYTGGHASDNDARCPGTSPLMESNYRDTITQLQGQLQGQVMYF